MLQFTRTLQKLAVFDTVPCLSDSLCRYGPTLMPVLPFLSCEHLYSSSTCRGNPPRGWPRGWHDLCASRLLGLWGIKIPRTQKRCAFQLRGVPLPWDYYPYRFGRAPSVAFRGNGECRHGCGHGGRPSRTTFAGRLLCYTAPKVKAFFTAQKYTASLCSQGLGYSSVRSRRFSFAEQDQTEKSKKCEATWGKTIQTVVSIMRLIDGLESGTRSLRPWRSNAVVATQATRCRCSGLFR